MSDFGNYKTKEYFFEAIEALHEKVKEIAEVNESLDQLYEVKNSVSITISFRKSGYEDNALVMGSPLMLSKAISSIKDGMLKYRTWLWDCVAAELKNLETVNIVNED